MTDFSPSDDLHPPSTTLSEEFLTPGEKFGDYQVLQCLTFGFFGGLYTMENIDTGDASTVAVLPRRASKSEGFRERFEEYVDKLKELEHPQMLKVVEATEIKEQLCIILEAVTGCNLNDYLLEQIRIKQTAAGTLKEDELDSTRVHTQLALARHDFGLPSKEARTIITTIAAGLRFAHDSDFRHLDLNPTNIIRLDDGSVRIWGFGLFDLFGKPLFESLVSAGIPPIQVGPKKIVINTIDTLSPEVRGGFDADRRSDIYALGLVSYFVLTGRSPDSPVEPPSATSSTIMSAWDQIVLKCLEDRPDDRHPTVGAFEKALKELDRQEKEEAAVGGMAGTIEQIPLPQVMEEKLSAKAKQSVRIGLLVVMAVLTIGTAAMLFQILSTDDPSGGLSGVVKRATAEQTPTLSLTIEPPWAKVEFVGDGSFIIQDGSLAVVMPPGTYTINTSAKGHKDGFLRLTLADAPLERTITMEKAWSTFELTGLPGASVTAIDSTGETIPLGLIPESGSLVAERVLIEGTYDFLVSKTNYEGQGIEGVDLIVDQTVSRSVTLDPLPARVRFISEPEGAYVYVNNQPVGQTPITIDQIWAEKPIVLRAILEAHRERREEVTLPAGFDGTIDFGALEPRAGRIHPVVTVSGNPAEPAFREEVEIRVSERSYPFTDYIPGIPEGRHTVTVEHPDYLPVQRNIAVNDREQADFSVDLLPRPAQLVVQFDDEVAYTVVANGREIALADGSHAIPAGVAVDLEIRIPNHLTARRRAIFDPNEKATWKIPLERIPEATLGQDWTVPYVSMKMAWIQPGSYTMGSPPTEQSRLPEEGEMTRVTLTTGFWSGRYEVTQAQFEAIMSANPSDFEGAQKPVDSVTWQEAAEFCRRLTIQEQEGNRIPDGYVYRLPTEAEWEYLCRAGTSTPFAFGAEVDPSSGNFRGIYPRDLNAGTQDSSTYGSVEVGQFSANRFGLFDMHGNVREWTRDWFNSRLPGQAVTDWVGPAQGSDRVARGGSWSDPAHRCRSAARERFDPGTRSSSQGFRVVLAPALN